MRILAVLGIEVTACVTILARITRRPPGLLSALTHRAGSAEIKGEMRAGPPAERSLRGQAARQSRSNKAGKANASWARSGRAPRVGQRQIITGPPAERSLRGRAARHNRNRYSRNNKRARLGRAPSGGK